MTALVAQAGEAANGPSPEPAPILVRGSVTLTDAITAAARRYALQDPGFALAVQGSGTVASIRAVAQGDAALGMAVRDLKADEREAFPEVVARPWGLDAVVLVVNAANHVPGLTSAQVRGLYAGTIRQWREVGGSDLAVVPIGRVDGLATLDYFADAFGLEVVTTADGRNQWYRVAGEPSGRKQVDVAVAGTHIEALARVVADPAALTFSPLGTARSLIARGGAVRIVPLDGVEPTDEAVRGGHYRLARPLYLLARRVPGARLAGFLAWLQTGAGQAVLADQGFVAP